MPRAKIKCAADRVSRARARAAIGSLTSLRIAGSTRRRYVEAASQFLVWLQSVGEPWAADFADLEQQLVSYIEHLWMSGESKAVAGDTLSAVQFFLRRRRIVPAAWDLFTTWGRVEAPQRAPPLPWQVLLAMCALAVQDGFPQVAAALIIGFHCLLRTHECATLRRRQVSLSNAWTGAVALPWTKMGQQRGAQEIVTFDDAWLGRFVAAAMRNLRPDDFILESRDQGLRSFMALAGQRLGCRVHYTPYSLRRGGATFDFLVNKNLSKTVLRGRWADSRTARIYITDGAAVQQSVKFSEAERQAIMSQAEWFVEVLKH